MFEHIGGRAGLEVVRPPRAVVALDRLLPHRLGTRVRVFPISRARLVPPYVGARPCSHIGDVEIVCEGACPDRGAGMQVLPPCGGTEILDILADVGHI